MLLGLEMLTPGGFYLVFFGLSALVLGVLCLAWLPYWLVRESFGAAQPIVGGTFYSLIFIASALYLFAGREVLGESIGRWRGIVLWVAAGLVAMYGRNFLGKLADMPVLLVAIETLMLVIPLTAGLVLVAMSRRSWHAVGETPAPEAAPIR